MNRKCLMGWEVVHKGERRRATSRRIGFKGGERRILGRIRKGKTLSRSGSVRRLLESKSGWEPEDAGKGQLEGEDDIGRPRRSARRRWIKESLISRKRNREVDREVHGGGVPRKGTAGRKINVASSVSIMEGPKREEEERVNLFLNGGLASEKKNSEFEKEGNIESPPGGVGLIQNNRELGGKKKKNLRNAQLKHICRGRKEEHSV